MITNSNLIRANITVFRFLLHWWLDMLVIVKRGWNKIVL